MLPLLMLTTGIRTRGRSWSVPPEERRRLGSLVMLPRVLRTRMWTRVRLRLGRPYPVRRDEKRLLLLLLLVLVLLRTRTRRHLLLRLLLTLLARPEEGWRLLWMLQQLRTRTRRGQLLRLLLLLLLRLLLLRPRFVLPSEEDRSLLLVLLLRLRWLLLGFRYFLPGKNRRRLVVLLRWRTRWRQRNISWRLRGGRGLLNLGRERTALMEPQTLLCRCRHGGVRPGDLPRVWRWLLFLRR